MRLRSVQLSARPFLALGLGVPRGDVVDASTVGFGRSVLDLKVAAGDPAGFEVA
jgi:hypothetical protein